MACACHCWNALWSKNCSCAARASAELDLAYLPLRWGMQEPLSAGGAVPAAESAAAVQVVTGQAAVDQRGHGDSRQGRPQPARPLIAQRCRCCCPVRWSRWPGGVIAAPTGRPHLRVCSP